MRAPSDSAARPGAEEPRVAQAVVAPAANGAATTAPGPEEMPRIHFTRRSLLIFGLFVVSALAFLYFVLPQLAGLSKTWERVKDGRPSWLVLAVAFELCSFASYVALFRTVFIRGGSRVDWRESYQITMAGVAATRLFAAAGAGGVAITAWALRRSGLEARVVACRMVAFLSLLYVVYMLALLLGGIGLRTGVLPGEAPFAFTVVPAAFGGVAIAVFGAMALIPGDFERRLKRAGTGTSRRARWATRAATAPATAASGVRTALDILRGRQVGVLGAVGWWAFDIAVLWACFHAFGDAPPVPVVVMGYFVGMLANTLPLPGGVGGVDGGMIGAFLAFGVDPALAVVAVLVYRGIAFWLPTVPGLLAYLQLRRTVHRWDEEGARPGARRATIQTEA